MSNLFVSLAEVPTMSERTFDRETLLDLSVNVIPLGILAFFVVVYAVVGSFPDDPIVIVIQMSILLLTAGGLVMLTYYSGKAVAGAEEEMDEYIPAGYSREDAERGSLPGDHGGPEAQGTVSGGADDEDAGTDGTVDEDED